MRSAQRGSLREINVDTLTSILNSTRPPLTWSPSQIEKRETMLFLWKPHTQTAGFAPVTHAWLARQSGAPVRHAPFWISVIKKDLLFYVQYPKTAIPHVWCLMVSVTNWRLVTVSMIGRWGISVQCCYNVVPALQTVDQHYDNIAPTTRSAYLGLPLGQHRQQWLYTNPP